MIFAAPEIQKRTTSRDLTQTLSLNGTNPHKWDDSFPIKAVSRAMLAE